PGGSLSEGVKLAEIIRYGRIATIVPNGSSCASACFVAFAAGAQKIVSYTGSPGGHGASEASGRESGRATVSMARIVRDLGVPEAIIGKMVVTRPEDIVLLTADDLRSMGTTMTGKPAQVPPEQQSAAAPPPMQLSPSATATTAPTSPVKTWKELV